MNDITPFGVSQMALFIIVFFWVAVFLTIFGGSIGIPFVSAILVFFVIGTAILIGSFGWQFLILPALLIIAAAVFFVRGSQ
jgi:hypothetical protein